MDLIRMLLEESFTSTAPAAVVGTMVSDPVCVWCGEPITDLISLPMGSGSPMHVGCCERFHAEYDDRPLHEVP